MRQVVIAFATTGASPKKGHRMSELVAIECQENGVMGRVLHQHFKVDDTQSANKTFAEQFNLLDEMIGGANLIVHDRVVWGRFMRQEIGGKKNRSARRLLKDVTDIVTWARQKFPRQRKDVKSIARALQIKVERRLEGVRQEAEILFLIASRMRCNSDEPIALNVDLVESGNSVGVSRGSERRDRFCFGLSDYVFRFWRRLLSVLQ